MPRRCVGVGVGDDCRRLSLCRPVPLCVAVAVLCAVAAVADGTSSTANGCPALWAAMDGVRRRDGGAAVQYNVSAAGSCCEDAGVTCSAGGAVIALDLSHRQLTGALLFRLFVAAFVPYRDTGRRREWRVCAVCV